MPTHGFTRASDGTELWFELRGQRADAPVLVLLNGANCSTHYWPPMLRFLDDRMPVLLWDYRGHGRSARGIDPATVTIEVFANDLLAVLDAAGVERAVLLGHSLGVMVALEACRLRPERTAGLVALFGTYGDAVRAVSDAALAPWLLDRGLELAARLVDRRPLRDAFRSSLVTRFGLRLASALGANPARLPAGYLIRLMEHMETMQVPVMANCFRAAIYYCARAALPEMHLPALVVAGGLDRLTPPARAREMADLLPDAELCVLREGSHLGMLECESELHEHLERFLHDRGLMHTTPEPGAKSDVSEVAPDPVGAAADADRHG